MIFHRGILLLLTGCEMFVLLEPCEIHGFPLLVPCVFEILRRSIGSSKLTVFDQLSQSLLLVILEDSGAAPNIPDREVKILRL